MHLVTSCSRLSPSSYTPTMTLHFRHVTHSMRLQSSFQIYSLKKISKFRCEFTPSVSNVDIYTDGEYQTCILNAFEPATETEIGILLLKSSPVKSYELDPIPTWLLRDCAHDILPVLATIVNKSLRTGVMPSHLKRTHVRPIIKKPGLDKDILNNYRPVSNPPYLSKTIERVVAARLPAHMAECNLCVPNQSAWPNHSVEAALACMCT